MCIHDKVKSYLVMVMNGIVATVAANASAWSRESAGALHGAAGIYEGHGAWGLWSRMVHMVVKVMSTVVRVLRTALLR